MKDDNKKALTISIAAYNVEKYLDHLMASIIQADVMDRLEILIVDDGSKDRTADIATRYELQYSQSVRLIRKANGGHGSTINKGIEEASGRYFRALDGDDWVNPEHLTKLIKIIDDIDSDIILSDFCFCYENGKNEEAKRFSELDNCKEYHLDQIWHPGFWMCYHTVIYRTEILKKHHIRLDEHCFYVDVEFMLYPIPYIDTIYFFRDYIYCYRVGNEGQSVSDISRMKNINHSKTVAESLISYYLNNMAELSEEKKAYFLEEIAFHCRWHEDSLLLFSPNKKRKRELIEFDRKIRENMPELYRKMSEQSKATRILRSTGYYTYRMVRFIKKMKAKKAAGKISA